MKSERLIEFMQYPEKMGEGELRELEALVARYPYFQAARILYLKALYMRAGGRFRQELKSSTVHITDHKQLLRYLYRGAACPADGQTEWEGSQPIRPPRPETEQVANQAPAQGKEEQPGANPVRKERPGGMEDAYESRQEGEATQGSATRPASVMTLDLDMEDLEEMDNVENGRVEAFDTPEIRGAAYRLKPEKEETELPQEKKWKRKDDLIEQFILTEPGMPKITESPTDMRDLSQENPYPKEELFSETLAKIYVKQHLYEKAIATYIKLSLKYPEKSVYFADRIEKIKENINNQE